MINDKIGQHIFIGLSGLSLQDDEKKFIVKNNISGVVLFSRNYQSPEQLHSLVSELTSLQSVMPEKLPLFISVDMEGGRVQRFKQPFTVWPPMRKFGELNSPNVGYRFAESLGKELGAFGINLNFAPCVDVLTNPENKAIGDRSLGSDPEHVGKMASAIVRGFVKSGVLCCAKHFPGHGNTLIDSHDDLPVEAVDLERLRAVELIPFKRSLRARLDLIMTTHILFKNIDPTFPVTFSEKILKEILRRELGFKGLIISDDLGMGALKKNFTDAEIPVHALRAGVNLLLYCNEPHTPPIALEAITKALQSRELSEKTLNQSYELIVKVKKEKLSQSQLLPFAQALETLNRPEHKALATGVASGNVPDELKVTSNV